MIIASARHIKSRRNTSTAHGPSRASVEGVSATRAQSKPYNPQAASAVARAPPHRVAPARSKAAQLSRVQWLPAESHPTFQNYIAHKADWRHLSSVPGLTAARGLGTHRRTAASDPCAEALRCQADRTRLKQRYPPPRAYTRALLRARRRHSHISREAVEVPLRGRCLEQAAACY